MENFQLVLLLVVILCIYCVKSQTIITKPSEHKISDSERIKFADTDDDNQNWWKNSVFYQIYPRSFKDSGIDGEEGVGDLKGIIQNLGHLKNAGIGAAWLSPVFASPMKDFGYDVSDFYNVDPIFGKNDDLMNLLHEAHALGIKLILDFVPNHTSDQHQWFEWSVEKKEPYTDYYVWHEGIERPDDPTTRDPPNNWLSVFSGSAWSWHPVRNEFYLHQFTPEQPDLNFRNTEVQGQMFAVIKYWIEQGFDGFRIDAINHMFEIKDHLLDEPVANPAVTDNQNDYEYLDHIYTRDLDETYDIVREWRKWIDDYNAAHPDDSVKILLTEVYADFDLTMRWYGTEDEPISHIPFNFDFIMDLNPQSTVEQIKEVVDRKIAGIPEFGLPNWVMGNHDRNRVASRYSPAQVDAINIIGLTLPGIAVTYYGEEIGMEDNQDITWEETVDPRACQTNDSLNYQALSRDPVRTPFQWDNTINAGFSTNPLGTWLPVHTNYETNNLKAQTDATESHFKVYQQLTALRQKSEFRIGGYQSIAANNIFSYKRSLNDDKGYIVAVNFKDVHSSIDFTEFSLPRDAVGTVVLSSTGSSKRVTSFVSTESLILEPFEAIIFYYTNEPVDWWKNSIFYQIYPRSFKDGNGDGVGDLKGIIENLDHLQDAGVGAVWLSPIFKSPMVDMGYDIEDYRVVDPLFGTNDELIELLEKAHELGLKLILDLVPNHTSDQHEWFKKSAGGADEYYKDFYIWDAGEISDGGAVSDIPKPPNNWISVFSGSAWEWHPGRKEYYLHQFYKEQPDLNFHNPNVQNEIFSVLKHYVELGFDGFRIDAINHLFEDEDLNDELPLDPPKTNDETAYDFLNHTYTKDLDKSYNVVREWRKWIDLYNAQHPEQTTKVLLTEAYTDFDLNLKWYGDEDNPISHIPFNFDLITYVTATTDVVQIKDIINKRLNAIPSFAVPNWVLGNHDNSRVGSRFSTEQIDGLNILVMTLPGIAVTYYGEEIGMLDFTDLELENYRDPERTPFQWDDTINAGFSTNTTGTWLKVHPDYVTNNLKLQKEAAISHYKTYQMLSQLRKLDEFLYGSYESVAENNVLIYKRFILSNRGYAVAINFGPSNQTVPFSKLNPPLEPSAIVMAASAGSARTHGDEIDPLNLELTSYEALVFSYISSPTTNPPSETPDPDWWKKTVFYQIYPRSFKDSDSNGIGDLQGVIDNLNHFNTAGIGAVWLSPVFSSPMKDFGYDISDFYQVDPTFGTTADLKILLEEARKLGIKVILDFVPNHTSDQHEWFKRSVRREGIFTDFYIWHDGIVNAMGVRVEPNNWLSVFSGSAWTWHPDRQQYYLRQFTPEQPDLNFRNLKVLEEIFKVLKYWIEMGFDGFRIDAINHMFEVKDLLLNEPILNPPITMNQNDYDFLDHIYTRDLNETYAIVREWRKWVDEYSAAHPDYPTKILLTEVYADFEKTMAWHGTADEPISHIPFNFDLIMDVENFTTVDDIKLIIDRKISGTPWFGLPNWVSGNHDRNRVASRFSAEQVDGLNILVMTLPGIAVTYYGEEIGMEDNQNISWNETVDPRACQTNDSINYQALSRDPVRTPFQWDNTVNAGFSRAEKTWLPVHDNYLTLNLKAQKEAPFSHFKLYQTLTALRQQTEFLNGNYKSVAENGIFAYKREILSNSGYGVAINFGNATSSILFKNVELPINPIAEIVAVSGNSNRAIEESFNPESIELRAYEAIIFYYKSNIPEIPVPNDSDPDWWKKTVFYQIYPRSFKDSDGNGIGDLNGIIDGLDHFIESGVGAIWLSPVFSSPMKDFGYDISDFYNVDHTFGQKADLIELLVQARALGIKVILDFVPNHTSDQHVWFQKSVNSEGIFKDFYIWQDGTFVAGQDRPNPPNNWLSVFSGSAWTWNDRRKQYYLHQFTPEQPDLNFRNPLVREEMFNVIKYWVEMGFDGFRVDAINHMFEVTDFSLNEPVLIPAVTTNPNEYEYLEHIYTRDLDETYEVVREWREWMDEYSKNHPELPTKILLTEAYTEFDLTIRWYGSEEEPISHVPFNFDFIMDIGADTTVDEIKAITDRKIAAVPLFGLPNWVMGNHDRNRVASRFTRDQVDAINILAMTLPGIAVTYYGEEIGMEDNQDITWDETVDPRACQTNDPENYKIVTRDPVRTPFQWNSSMHAGFSSNETRTWLPVHSNYIDLNLAAQKVALSSHYKVYQELTALRKNPEFLVGYYSSIAVSNTFNYIRRSTGGKTYGIAINFSNQSVTIDFTPLVENAGFSNPVGTIQILSVNSPKSPASIHDLDSLNLAGYEAIVFEVGSLGTKLAVSIGLLIAAILRNLI